MEVDAEGDPSSRELSGQELISHVLRRIVDDKVWYTPISPDMPAAKELANQVLNLVSLSPGHVYTVVSILATRLVRGASDAEACALVVGGKSYPSRAELNAECRAILKRCPGEFVHLEGDDAKTIRELLVFNPSGDLGARNCKAIAVGTHPTFEKRCFFVVRDHKKKPKDFSYARCVDNFPTHEVHCQRRICDVIRSILQLHPTACGQICNVMEEKFPSFLDYRLTVEKQRNWTQCVLYMCTELSGFTEWALALIVRKCIDNDCGIVKLEEEVKPEKGKGKGKGEDVPGEKVLDAHGQTVLHKHAQVLDAQMMLLFEYLQRNLGDPKGPANPPLVPLMFGIFQTRVMPTYRSKYVQFLFFYLASLRVNWTESFLKDLLTTVYSQDQTLEKRLVALSYLASFVARAKFLTPLFGIKVVQYLTAFVMEIQETAEKYAASRTTDDEEKPHHPMVRLFVAGVQSICYILCFRIGSFAGEEEAKGQLMRLMPAWGTPRTVEETFTPVLASALNPITWINRNVAKQFLMSIRHEFPSIASQTKAMYKKMAKSDGVIVDNDDEDVKFDMTAFYPFDPYRLSGSHIFLVGIYQNWDKDDAFDVESTAESESDGCQGFEAEEDMTTRRARAGSRQPSADSGDSDVDFTDIADATDRGFIPSVGPSPALRPRRYTDFEMSPLIVPMEAAEEDDHFALPVSSIDNRANTVLDSFLKSSAFATGSP